MRSLVAVSIALAILLGTATAGEGPNSRPNVLFIAVDDLNDWVGCLRGHPQAHAQHRPSRAAGHPVRQCALPGAPVQSVPRESAHGTEAIVDRHLRPGTGNPGRSNA